MTYPSNISSIIRETEKSMRKLKAEILKSNRVEVSEEFHGKPNFQIATLSEEEKQCLL